MIKVAIPPYYFTEDYSPVQEDSTTASQVHELEPEPEVVSTGLVDQSGRAIKRTKPRQKFGFVP